MSAPTLTIAQQAVLDAAESDLEDGFLDGFLKPDTSEAIPKLNGYDQAKNVNGKDYSDTVKAPFKAGLVTTIRHIDKLNEDVTIVSLLSNGWVYDNTLGYNHPGYYKDPFGRVYLQGKLKDGSQGALFTLPLGYRPANINVFAAIAETVTTPMAVTVTVKPDGTVNVVFPTAITSFSLDGASFRVAP